MHEVATSIHIRADAVTVWRALCQMPRSPIVAPLALRERVRCVYCPSPNDCRPPRPASRRFVCEFEEGTVEETVVAFDPPRVMSFEAVGGTLNSGRWLDHIRDRFTVAPNCDGVLLTRTTQFEAGRNLHRVAGIPKVKRQIRKLQFRFLGDIKLHAERSRSS